MPETKLVSLDDAALVSVYQWDDDGSDEPVITGEYGNLTGALNPGVYFVENVNDDESGMPDEYVLRVDGADGEILRLYPYNGDTGDARDFA